MKLRSMTDNISLRSLSIKEGVSKTIVTDEQSNMEKKSHSPPMTTLIFMRGSKSGNWKSFCSFQVFDTNPTLFAASCCLSSYLFSSCCNTITAQKYLMAAVTEYTGLISHSMHWHAKYCIFLDRIAA